MALAAPRCGPMAPLSSRKCLASVMYIVKSGEENVVVVMAGTASGWMAHFRSALVTARGLHAPGISCHRQCPAMQSSKNIPSSLAHLEVRHSSVHGYGVFAARELPFGTLVGAYAGRRYTAHEARAMAWDDE